ncbi:extended synaptotagmin-2-like [Sycon ciliatum]|uniref:extended synaptotagmin-2-like n=1 Tax=Sycon ciliatum TaxID=27933 RepID=UPI0031F6592B
MAESSKAQGISGPLPASQNVGWLNEVTAQAWTFINSAVAQFAKTALVEELEKQTSLVGKLVKVQNLDIGTEPFSLNGVTVEPNPRKLDRIAIDFDFTYDGNPDIDATLAGAPLGIDNVKFAGRLRVIIGPLMHQLPIIGAISFFFVHEPTFDFNLTGILQVGDFWIIRNAVDSAVRTCIQEIAILPNRQVILLDKTGAVDANLVKHPFPQSVMFVTIVDITNVEDKDLFGGGSDVYVQLKVGGSEYRTSVKDDVETTTVIFNERVDMLLEETFDQILTISVFDEDNLLSDDTLGHTSVNLSSVAKDTTISLKLSDTKKESNITLCFQPMLLSQWKPIVSPRKDISGETLPSHLLIVKIGAVYDLPNADSNGYTATVSLLDHEPQKKSLDIVTDAESGTVLNHSPAEDNRQCRFLISRVDGTITIEISDRDVSIGQFNLTFDNLRMAEEMCIKGQFTLDSGTLLDLHYQLFGIVPCP